MLIDSKNKMNTKKLESILSNSKSFLNLLLVPTSFVKKAGEIYKKTNYNYDSKSLMYIAFIGETARAVFYAELACKFINN